MSDRLPSGQDFTADEIIYRAGRYVGSRDRIGLLMRDLARSSLSTPDFWRVFQSVFPDCDDTWWYRSEILIWCRRHGVGTSYLTGDCKTFFDDLPDDIPVYRGCSPERVRGLSWTTDRKVAEGFAQGHRGISVPNGTVYSAKAVKAYVLTVSTDRQESEIIVDPRRLRSIAQAVQCSAPLATARGPAPLIKHHPY